MKRIVFNLFLLLACTTWLRAEEFIIKGKVINQDGEAITDAIISVDEWQGNKTQYISDSDGRYTFSINSYANFQVTAEGYTSYKDDSGIYGSGSIEMNIVLYNAIIFKAGQQSSIILPVEPDPSLGKYYRLDRVEENNIIFERELQPKANVPYVFVAHNDVRIDLRGMDLSQEAGRVDIKVTPPNEESREGSVTFMGYYSTYNFDLPVSDIWSTFFGELPNIDNYEPRPLEAMHASLVYEWWLFDRTPELVFNDSEETPYRPFIEEGKVWKVVRNHIPVPIPELNKDYWTIESHYFEGDTIVGGYPCKKMMEAHDVLSTGDHSEFYDGAIFEEGRRVYCAWPNNVSFFLLYDFASTEGSEVSFCDYEWGDPYYGQIQKSFRQDDKFHGWTTTFADVFLPDEDDYPFPVNLDWMEGVGYQGFYNFVKTDKAGYIRELLSCTVGDEVLYYDAELAAKMAPADPSEVKKNTIDFTHVVKSQPKAPERSLTPNPSPVREGSQEEETLTGEYSLKELFVNFKPLAGPYVITICDDSGTEVYRKEVQTSNVIGLNTDISGYEKGEYTITVENEEEAYTAEFKIDDETGINRPTPDPSLYGGEKAGAWYDLSGRKVSPTPAPSPVRAGKKLPRGVYIKDRRKVVVK